MPMRNGYKSHRGRSAVARNVIMSGSSSASTNLSGAYFMNVDGNTVQKRAGSGGGNIKGGMAPNATGFNTMYWKAASMSSGPDPRNYIFKTNYGYRPLRSGVAQL